MVAILPLLALLLAALTPLPLVATLSRSAGEGAESKERSAGQSEPSPAERERVATNGSGVRAVASTPAELDLAARTRWPLLDPAVEAQLVANRARLDPEARRLWALDRALPMLAGEIPVDDAALREVIEAAAASVAPRERARAGDLGLMEEARRAYAARDLRAAAERYGRVAKDSPLWSDALRERAWTLVILGRPEEALGSTVSLKAPYFPPEDQAEARLMKATVLLDRCRFEEARAEIAPIADQGSSALDEGQALAALRAGVPPSAAVSAWNSPLVVRVREALAVAGEGALRERLITLGARLLTQSSAGLEEAARELRERALRLRYESIRTERGLLEEGIATERARPPALPPLGDDDIAWSFTGTFWRDELGAYRYSAGSACPRGKGR